VEFVCGFASSCQLGILTAAPTNQFEYALQGLLGYSSTLACFEIATISVLAVAVSLGSEHRGRSVVQSAGDGRLPV